MQQRRSNAKICTALGKNTFNIMYDLNLQVSDHGNKNIMYHFNYSNKLVTMEAKNKEVTNSY